MERKDRGFLVPTYYAERYVGFHASIPMSKLPPSSFDREIGIEVGKLLEKVAGECGSMKIASESVTIVPINQDIFLQVLVRCGTRM